MNYEVVIFLYISKSSCNHIMIYQSMILVDKLQVKLSSLIKLVKLQIIGCMLCFFYCISEMNRELLNFYVIYGYICASTSKYGYCL